MQQDLSVSLGDVFRFLRRGLLLAVVLAAIGAGVAYFVSSSRTPTFETDAILLATLGSNIDLPGVDVNIVAAPSINPSSYEAAAKSQEVIGSALTRLGLEVTPARVSSVRGRYSVSPDSASGARDSSSQITLGFRGSEPQNVATTLNALANALIDWDRQRAETFIRSIVTQSDRAIAETQRKITQREAAGAWPRRVGPAAKHPGAAADQPRERRSCRWNRPESARVYPTGVGAG